MTPCCVLTAVARSPCPLRRRPSRDRSVVARHGLLVGRRRAVVLAGGDPIARPPVGKTIGERRFEILERVLHVLRERLPARVILLERFRARRRAAELVPFGRAVGAVAAVLASIARAVAAAVAAAGLAVRLPAA